MMFKKKMSSFICAVSLLFGQVGFAEEKTSNSADTGFIKPDAPQFAQMGTELGKYQHKLYLSIGRKWNLKIQQTMGQFGKERVVVKFHVNPDGEIANMNIVEGNPESKLAIVSKEAIAEGGLACGQFSEALKKEKPDGFDWQLAYRIY
jgi:hypothetical protein